MARVTFGVAVLVLVLVLVLEMHGWRQRMAFDHERLDVYRVTVEFTCWCGALLDGPLGKTHLSVIKQLERASTSISLNIAEGNGKRSSKDRCRYFDTREAPHSNARRASTCSSHGSNFNCLTSRAERPCSNVSWVCSQR